jgi:peptidoglycan hydrolase-like protein with peptidoglycan-binding domain
MKNTWKKNFQTKEAAMRRLLIILTLLLSFSLVTSAQAGLFDSVLSQTKKAAEEAVNEAIKQTAPQQETTTQPPPAGTEQAAAPLQTTPDYSPVLVRQIQEGLNQLGINAGQPDGQYGPGTRQAIETFQSQRGLTVTGLPSQGLLTQIKSYQTTGSVASATTTPTAANGLPTSDRQMARAVIGLTSPAWLDKQSDYELKSLVRIFYPEENDNITDQFYWHNHKDDLIRKMFAESQGAPTTYTVAPWLDNAYSKAMAGGLNNYHVETGQYDFNRQAIPFYYMPPQIPWMTTHQKYALIGYRLMGVKDKAETLWVKIPPDKAEILYKKNQGGLRLIGRYTFTLSKVVGLDPTTHPDYEKYKEDLAKGGQVAQYALEKLKPLALVEIKGRKIDLYLQTKPGNIIHATSPDDFLYVTTLDISAPEKAAAVEPQAPAKPAGPQYLVPQGITLLEGDALSDTLLGNTVAGNNWAVYFGKDDRVETFWQRQPNQGAFTVKDPLICFGEGSKIAVRDCIAAGLDEKGMIHFYAYYNKPELTPYPMVKGPFRGPAKLLTGRVASLLDPDGILKVADADILGIKLGMTPAEVDRLVRAHRPDMQKVSYDGHTNQNIKPWDPGYVHVRYEAPDKREVIGVQFEPPTAGDQATLVWRSITYDVNSGAPKAGELIKALFAKYGGDMPDLEKYPGGSLYNWVNNGGGLHPELGCSARPNELWYANLYDSLQNPEIARWNKVKPAPVIAGPLNYIDTKCGETVTASVGLDSGYVKSVTVYLVNQANLEAIVKANEKAVMATKGKTIPKF